MARLKGYLLALCYLTLIALAIASPLAPFVQKPQHPSDTNTSQKTKPDKFPWEVVGIIVGAVFTGVIAVYSIRQFEESRHSSERQLRAYVLLDSGNLWDASGVGAALANPNANPPARVLAEFSNYIKVYLTIKNSGQTPARRIIHWADLTISEPTTEYSLVAPVPLDERQASVLGPGQSATKELIAPFPLTPDVIDDIKRTKKAIYVWGKITYLDAFKRPRSTWYRLGWAGNWPPLPMGTFSFTLHGNDFD